MLDVIKYFPLRSVTDLGSRNDTATYVSKQDGKKGLFEINLVTGVESCLWPELNISNSYSYSLGKLAWNSKSSKAYYIDSDANLACADLNASVSAPLTVDTPFTEITQMVDGNQVVATVDESTIALFCDEIAESSFRTIYGVDKKDDHFIADLTTSEDFIAFRQWSDNTMPWYSSELVVIDYKGNTHWRYSNKGHMVSQPRFSPDGTKLAFISSHLGNLSIYVISTKWNDLTSITSDPFDYGNVDLGLGQKSYCWDYDSIGIYANRNENGFGRFVGLDTSSSSEPIDITKGFVEAPTCGSNFITGIRSGARTPPVLVSIDRKHTASDTINLEPIKRPLLTLVHSELEKETLVEPRLFWTNAIPTSSSTSVLDTQIASRVYHCRKPEESRGTIISLHGGPVGQSTVRYDPSIAFLNSIGFDVVTADPRGSTGHGIDFINALSGIWGSGDLYDVESLIDDLSTRSIITGPFFAMGSSAGGYLALKLATSPKSQLAGVIASSPVVDPYGLSIFTHRFEKSYTDILLGSNLPIYQGTQSRTPIDEATMLQCPVLIFHGNKDTVVPIDATRSYVARAVQSNKNIKFVEIEGEGHGWSKPEVNYEVTRVIQEFLNANLERN